MWTGRRSDNRSAATFGLWFSGHHTIDAVLQHLSATTSLNSTVSPSLVVFSGGSAGGVGAFANVEHVADRLPSATVLGAPIGGYVPAVQWYDASSTRNDSHRPVEDLHDAAFRHHTRLWDSHLPAACARALSSSPNNNNNNMNGAAANRSYLCLVPRLAYPYYTRPLFIIEALTDACVLCEFEGVGVSDNACHFPLLRPRTAEAKRYMAQYGENATRALAQVLNSSRDGVFAPACFIHCGFKLDKPLIAGVGVIEALHRWVAVRAGQQMGPKRGQESEGLAGNQAMIGGRGGGSTRRSNPFHWIDSCGTSSPTGLWPPCNPTCPLIPSERRERGEVNFLFAQQ